MELDRDRDAKNRNPFSVPDGFFEGLPTRIQERAAQANTTETKPEFGLFSMVKHHVGIAAGVLFFVAAGYTGYRYNSYLDEKAVMPEDYYEFVNANSSQFSEQELIKVLNSDKKVATKKSLKKESDRIIQYLVDEQMDLSAIEDAYNNRNNEID